MTKAEEIDALRSFAQALPAETYTKAVLLAMLPSIERDIKADIIPDPYREIQHARNHLAELVAESRALDIKAKAQRETIEANTRRLDRQAKEFNAIADHARQLCAAAARAEAETKAATR